MQQAATQGQTIITASGDQGSTSCSGYTNLSHFAAAGPGRQLPGQQRLRHRHGRNRDRPRRTPASSNTRPTGTGQRKLLRYAVSSALKYIPEVAWNDDDRTYGLSASGGGASTLVAAASLAKRSHVPGEFLTGSMRLVPDISLYSSPGLPGYLYCTSDQTNWFAGSLTAPPAGQLQQRLPRFLNRLADRRRRHQLCRAHLRGHACSHQSEGRLHHRARA